MLDELGNMEDIANKDGHRRETLLTCGRTGRPKTNWS